MVGDKIYSKINLSLQGGIGIGMVVGYNDPGRRDNVSSGVLGSAWA